MSVVQGRNVVDQRLGVLDVICRMADPVDPGTQIQKVEALHLLFPFVRSVLVGVRVSHIEEFGDFLIDGQLSKTGKNK